MPLIRVELFEGRTDEQKKNMVREVTDAFIRTCGGDPGAVTIIIDESKAEHWASGGVRVSDR